MADNDPPTCARCDDEYALRDNNEPSKYCDPCAQERVSELEPMLKKLRDFIEFGPFYGTETTNIVIEADKVLKSESCAPKGSHVYKSPSNPQALEDVDDAQRCLRAEIKAAESTVRSLTEQLDALKRESK